MKRLLSIYTAFLLILTFIFWHLKLIHFDLIQLLLSIMCANIIVFVGIIGLKTNTIIIGRGDIEYDNNSVWGKIANYILILFGVVGIITAVVLYI